MRLDWRLHQGARRYIYLGGKLIAEQRDGSFGNEVTYSHADVLGSPMLRTNAAGAVVQTTMHEPYGATAAGWDVPARVGYTGHVNDPETGLVYMQQRYYDPIAGRFLSVDPVVTEAKTGSFFNRYEYAESNPYRYFDPDGRCAASRIGVAPGSICGGSAQGLQAHTVAAYTLAQTAQAQLNSAGRGLDNIISSLTGGDANNSTNSTSPAVVAGSGGGGCGDLHHICTNKNEKSPRNDGPWTPRFKSMFDKADMKLSDAENVVRLKGHSGPHPPQYHRYVFRYLEGRTEGLSGQEYANALRAGLRELGREITTPGTPLNKMLTK